MPQDLTLLYGMARQMYDDLRYIAGNNPKEIVDDDTAKMFNNLLDQANIAMPTQVLLRGFEHMSPRTIKYKDALIVAGQLTSLIGLIHGVQSPPPAERRPASAAPRQPQRAPGREAPVAFAPADDVEHDRELYGDLPLSRVNDDGTVPFTLE